MNGARRARGGLCPFWLLLGSTASCNAVFCITPGHPAATGGAPTTGGTGGSGGSSETPSTGAAGTSGVGGTVAPGACAGPPQNRTEWAVNPTGNGLEGFRALARTPSGDLLAAGIYFGDHFYVDSLDPLPYPTHDTGPGEDQNVFAALYSAVGKPLHSIGIRGEDLQELSGAAVDPYGNVVLGGLLLGDMHLAGSPETVLTPDRTVPSAEDGFVIKLDGALRPMWARVLGGPARDEVRAVATDSQGHVFVLGVASYGFDEFAAQPDHLTTKFGCDPPQPLNRDENRVFVTKLDTAGGCMWTRPFVIPTGFYGHRASGDLGRPVGLAMAVDRADGVVVAGGFYGVANFDGGVSLASTAGGWDVFVVALDASGATRWARRFGGEGFEAATAVAVAPSGDIWLGGAWRDSIDLGDGDALKAGDPRHDTNYSKAFVARLVPDPAPGGPPAAAVLHPLLDTGAITVTSIAVASDGDVLFGGHLYPEDGAKGVDFGDDKYLLPPAKDASGSYEPDGFVARYCPGGALRWARRYQTPRDEAVFGVAADGPRTFAAGQLGAPYDFEGGPATTLTPVGEDAFLIGVGP